MVKCGKTGLFVDCYIPVEVVCHVACADIDTRDDDRILVLFLVPSARLGYVDTIFLSVVTVQTLLFLLFERVGSLGCLLAVRLTFRARWDLTGLLILEVANFIAFLVSFLFGILGVDDLRLAQTFSLVFLGVCVELFFHADLNLSIICLFRCLMRLLNLRVIAGSLVR